jgi:hypothetical protein
MFNVVYRFFSNVCTVISRKPAIGRKNGHRLGWLPLDEEYNGMGPEWICHGEVAKVYLLVNKNVFNGIKVQPA